MADFIVIAIVAVITGAAARYVWKAKKSGKTVRTVDVKELQGILRSEGFAI